jgi:hypothetical protein
MFIVPFFYLYYKIMILIVIYFITMFNSLFNIDAQEYNRILEFHRSATKKHYLFNEQIVKTVKSEPKRFTLPNNTFVSGDYVNFNKAAVDEVIRQMNEYLKEFPKNQKIQVEIESSESKVPNRGVNLSTGELSKKRGQQMENYLKGKLPQNVTIILKDLGAQGPEWNPPDDATKEEIKSLASQDRYTRWQYVSFNIITTAEKDEVFCDLGFYIIVDYKKEWCTPPYESRCHKCDQAMFYMWANGVPLKTDKGDSIVNLNNFKGPDTSGPSVEVKVYVSEEQKKEILSKNPEEITITMGCALEECHSDATHVTIINTNGDVLLEPTFITTGKKLKKIEPPVELLKLDKCGEVISIYNPEIGGQKEVSPKIIPFSLGYDENDEYDVKKLVELYKLVENGLFKFPVDKMKYFKSFKHYQGKSWNKFVEDWGLTKKDLKRMEIFMKNNSQ